MKKPDSDTARPKLRVHAFTLSIDGYGAGPNQSLDNPLGVGGVALHGWAFTTRTFRKMFGGDLLVERPRTMNGGRREKTSMR